MQRLALLPLLTFVLAACADGRLPNEPDVDVTPVGHVLSSTQNGYTAIDLGTLGGVSSWALGINEVGQVVGWSYPVSGRRHAFLWDAVNGMQDLGAWGGDESQATDINDAGQVVGYNTTATAVTRAFLWDDVNGLQDLGTLGGISSQAYGINEAGDVVGWSNTVSEPRHAFLWSAVNGMQDLGTLGGYSSAAFDMNDVGQVVGYSYGTGSGFAHAFLWDAVNGMQDLGSLGGSFSWAYGINDAGQVVGWSSTASGDIHAFLWDAVNGMQDLGTLGGCCSEAYGINDFEQVVGYSWQSPEVPWYAFLWDGTKGMRDLGGLSDFAYMQARDINDAGIVVGWSVAPNLYSHATLWRILTPDEQLEHCAETTADYEGQEGMNEGEAGSLINKINLATALLNDGKTTPALKLLQAFQNQVNALGEGGALTPEQEEELISCVQQAIDGL